MVEYINMIRTIVVAVGNFVHLPFSRLLKLQSPLHNDGELYCPAVHPSPRYQKLLSALLLCFRKMSILLLFKLRPPPSPPLLPPRRKILVAQLLSKAFPSIRPFMYVRKVILCSLSCLLIVCKIVFQPLIMAAETVTGTEVNQQRALCIRGNDSISSASIAPISGTTIGDGVNIVPAVITTTTTTANHAMPAPASMMLVCFWLQSLKWY